MVSTLFKINTYEKYGQRVGGGAVHQRAGARFRYRTAASFTSQTIAAIPASNTPLSRATEMVCNRANSASKGFPATVASIDPICTRSTAILGLTATCEITVKIIISTTHQPTGAPTALKLRTRNTRTNKITTPQTIPIQCIRPSE